LGIGDWGLGIGDWGLGPIPNPQSPIPNPQSPIPMFKKIMKKIILKNYKLKIIIMLIKNYFKNNIKKHINFLFNR